MNFTRALEHQSTRAPEKKIKKIKNIKTKENRKIRKISKVSGATYISDVVFARREVLI